jgi:glyoxalase family protein
MSETVPLVPVVAERLKGHQVKPSLGRFGQEVLSFADPDGLPLEIVASAQPGDYASAGGSIPAETAIRGFHGITVSEEGYEKTAELLTQVMAFQADGEEGNRFRYRAGGDRAAVVDLLCVPDARHGALGAGVVHHVAFRTSDDQQQRLWRTELVRRGYNVTPVMDRMYFHSIYFREPGGVLFEIATDPPGFLADQAIDALGTRLMLPPWLEPYRSELEGILPRLRLPEWHR